MIAFRTAGTDSNPVGASAFVGIPQPVGVRDGDLLIVGIALPATGITVTPPSEDWIQVVQSDPSLTLGITAFYKTALNEPTNWVFQFSASIDATAAVVVYGDTDSSNPLEAFAEFVTSPSATVNFAAVSPSVDGDEIVLFAVAAASGTFTTATAHVEAATKAHAGSSISAQRRGLQAPGVQPAGSVTFSAVARNATLRIALRPGFGRLTVDQVRERILSAFPQGFSQWADLAPGGDYFKYFQVIASLAKTYAFDLVDLMRLEIVPYLSRYKLPDWERIFGLQTTRVTQLGTIPQRQAQVLGAWRAAAGQGSSIPEVGSVLGPLLGYFPTTPVEVLECSRSELDIEHTTLARSLSIADTATETDLVAITIHGGIVSTGGARLILELSVGSGALDVTLTSPLGVAKSWSIDASGTELTLLFSAEHVHSDIFGNWQISVTNNSGGAVTLLWSVRVEGVQVGIQPRQDTAAAIFDWGVYADPLHLGENGTPADFEAARRAIQGMAFAHTIANLIQSKVPFPDIDSGANSAIPDEAIPTA